jgi:hypothetical protein
VDLGGGHRDPGPDVLGGPQGDLRGDQPADPDATAEAITAHIRVDEIRDG